MAWLEDTQLPQILALSLGAPHRILISACKTTCVQLRFPSHVSYQDHLPPTVFPHNVLMFSFVLLLYTKSDFSPSFFFPSFPLYHYYSSLSCNVPSLPLSSIASPPSLQIYSIDPNATNPSQHVSAEISTLRQKLLHKNRCPRHLSCRSCIPLLPSLTPPLIAMRTKALGNNNISYPRTLHAVTFLSLIHHPNQPPQLSNIFTFGRR